MFAEVATASFLSSAGYEAMRERFSVKAVILISIGALILFLVLSGDDRLGRFWRGLKS